LVRSTCAENIENIDWSIDLFCVVQEHIWGMCAFVYLYNNWYALCMLITKLGMEMLKILWKKRIKVKVYSIGAPWKKI